MTPLNGQWRLAARPAGLPKPSDWEYVEEPAPEPADGQFLVKLEYLSLDPAMRGWMNEIRSYVPPVGINEVMRAGGIARVVESRHPDYGVGELVSGMFGVQRYALSNGNGINRVDTTLAPAPVHLGVLGMTGLTAYVGLLDTGRPEPDQTVVVSGAAVGSVAGQIARIKGCRVVGIAGGPENCECRPARAVAAQRRALLARGRGFRRPAPVPGGVPDAVPRREHRQAHPAAHRGRDVSVPLGYELRFWREFERPLERSEEV